MTPEQHKLALATDPCAACTGVGTGVQRQLVLESIQEKKARQAAKEQLHRDKDATDKQMDHLRSMQEQRAQVGTHVGSEGAQDDLNRTPITTCVINYLPLARQFERLVDVRVAKEARKREKLRRTVMRWCKEKGQEKKVANEQQERDAARRTAEAAAALGKAEAKAKRKEAKRARAAGSDSAAAAAAAGQVRHTIRCSTDGRDWALSIRAIVMVQGVCELRAWAGNTRLPRFTIDHQQQRPCTLHHTGSEAGRATQHRASGRGDARRSIADGCLTLTLTLTQVARDASPSKRPGPVAPRLYQSEERWLLSFAEWKRRHHVPACARVFSIGGGYDDLRQSLLRRGWFENPDPASLLWDLRWAVKARDVDQSRLHPSQVVNHFARVACCITTKAGLLSNLTAESRW